MKKLLILIVVCFIVIATSQVSANTSVTIGVSGKACPYFAGQTFGLIPPTPNLWFNIDTTDPGTMPPFIDVTGFGGTILSITATGTWGHGPGILSGPDGYLGYDPTDQEYVDLGISPMLNGQLNLLLGVFLTDAAPVMYGAPAPLDYNTSDMTSPALQQTFAIGSSLYNITIPSGATRLFLGLNNGYEWTNNEGSVDVTVTPIPAPGAILLAGIGAGLVGWLRRRRTL